MICHDIFGPYEFFERMSYVREIAFPVIGSGIEEYQMEPHMPLSGLEPLRE